MSALLAQRCELVARLFSVSDPGHTGDAEVTVNTSALGELLREFAECDWDAGRDCTLDDCSDLNPHRPVKP